MRLDRYDISVGISVGMFQPHHGPVRVCMARMYV